MFSILLFLYIVRFLGHFGFFIFVFPDWVLSFQALDFGIVYMLVLLFQPTNGGTAEPEVIENVLEALEITTTELPPPHPPSCRKQDLFADASVFNKIDEHVIKVGDHSSSRIHIILTYCDIVQRVHLKLCNVTTREIFYTFVHDLWRAGSLFFGD